MLETEKFILIPDSVLLNKDLSDKAKLLFGIILRLSYSEGYCYASNSYLAGQLGCSKKYASLFVKELSLARLISTEMKYADGEKRIEKRYIKILGEGIPKSWEGVSQNLGRGYPKILGG